MEGAEVGIAISPQDAQRRRDGAPAGRQDDAASKHQNVRPGRAREQIGEPCEPGQEAWRERIGRDGENTGMLHPIGRNQLAESRQSHHGATKSNRHRSSGLACRRATGTLTGMTKPDPTLAQIAARFTRHDVEKSGGGYMVSRPPHRKPRRGCVPFPTPTASSCSIGQTSKVAGQRSKPPPNEAHA